MRRVCHQDMEFSDALEEFLESVRHRKQTDVCYTGTRPGKRFLVDALEPSSFLTIIVNLRKMPLLIQPKTLYNGCLNFVNFIIDLTCESIAEEDEAYLNFRIAKLQELLQQLPIEVLDDICENRRLLAGRMSTDVRVCEIKLRVYMHRQMRHFKIDTGSNEYHLKLDDRFWRSQIYLLSRIQVLDLHLVCTDEILEMISKFCPELEEINIISRVVRETSQEPPSTKIKQFVSDKGLTSLSKCTRLKRIILNKRQTLKAHLERSVTAVGVKEVLKRLPSLEYINYSEMGEVFEDLRQITRLVAIYDSNPSSESLFNALLYCPFVTQIFLSMSKELPDKEKRSEAIFNCLKRSANQFARIELQGINTVGYLSEFLLKKGEYLRVLSLNDPKRVLTSKEVIYIGNLCANLTQLSIRDLSDENERQIIKPLPHAFRKLQHLNLSGKQWNFQKVLVPVLLKARHLEKLSLLNLHGMTFEINEVLQKVIKEGCLQNLRELYLRCGCFVSLSLLKKLLKKCKQIESISLRPNVLLQKADAEMLLNSYLEKNYKIVFNFDF